jgi:hypothetical protein
MQTGSTPERLAAMKARRVTGNTLVPPATFIAQRKGFHLRADVAARGLAYKHHGGVTTRKFLRENRARAKFCKTLHRGGPSLENGPRRRNEDRGEVSVFGRCGIVEEDLRRLD